MSKLQTVPVENIRVNPAALREVQLQSDGFLGIVESIKLMGFNSTVLVRPARDEETDKIIKGTYELIDGLHRFTAAKHAGITEVPVLVQDMADCDMLEAQIMANVHRVDTKPKEYAAQLLRILAFNPTKTQAELAAQLGKTGQWLAQILRLNKIDNEQVSKLIDDGAIPVSNAYALARLPEDAMLEFLEDAQTMPNTQFVPLVEKRRKEIAEARRQGKDAGPATFTPREHCRKLKDIRTEIDSGASLAAVISAAKPANPAEAATLALQWVLNIDPLSVEAQKAKWDADQAEKADKAQARAASRLADKETKAKAAAEEARKEREALEAGETATTEG